MLKNIRFVEVSNCVTDVILAFVLSILAYKLQHMPSSNAFTNAWENFFTAMSVATLLGGFGHLLSHYLDKYLLMVSWLMVIWGTFYIEHYMLNSIWQHPILNSILFLKSLTLSFWLMRIRLFLPTIISLIIGLAVIVCSVLSFLYWEKGIIGYGVMIVAILSSSLAGFVRARKINLASWFDANDLAHVISAFSFIGMYLGICKIVG
jgi:hypothetical protein